MGGVVFLLIWGFCVVVVVVFGFLMGTGHGKPRNYLNVLRSAYCVALSSSSLLIRERFDSTVTSDP